MAEDKDEPLFDIKKEPPQKVAYEWVVSRSKGDEVVISERQFEFYRIQVQERRDTSQIIFDDIVINPPFVTGMIRRKADVIKDKYPCHNCWSSGRKPDNTGWCDNCGGSGVDLPK